MEASQHRNITKQEQLELSPPGDSGMQSRAIPLKGQLCWVYIHQLLPVICRWLVLVFADLWALPAPHHTGRAHHSHPRKPFKQDADPDRCLSEQQACWQYMPPNELGKTIIEITHWFPKEVASNSAAHCITFAIKVSLNTIYGDLYFRRHSEKPQYLSPEHHI